MYTFGQILDLLNHGDEAKCVNGSNWMVNEKIRKDYEGNVVWLNPKDTCLETDGAVVHSQWELC